MTPVKCNHENFIKVQKKNYLATICIGKNLKKIGKIYTTSWKEYCKKNDIGLIYFDKDLISKKIFIGKTSLAEIFDW